MTNNIMRKRQISEDISTNEEVGFTKRVKSKNGLKLLSSYDSDSDPNDGIYSSDNNTTNRLSSKDNEVQEQAQDNDEDSDMFASDDDFKGDKIRKEQVDSVIDGTQQSHSPLLDIEKFNRTNELNSIQEKSSQNPTENITINDDSIKIEAFNLDEDVENGNFDKDGYYIRKNDSSNDSSNEQDQWIDNTSDVNSAQLSKEKQFAYIRKQTRDLRKRSRHYMVEDALVHLKYFIRKEGTVLTTLGDLNKMRKTTKDEMTKKYISNGINFITDLIDILEQKDFKNIYQCTREDISRLIKEESLSEVQPDNPKNKLWCFKWMKNLDVVHESYSTIEMNNWNKSYFRGKVLVKFQSDDDKLENWIHISCLDFS
ncbi:similar to Saccharomyces cerevisiae YHR156C LIN1 Non-essential component of U5 snRNP [Maudiozyma saulgeensis]|uniref:Similar to Saccharomyces cerevisiae YHR156C LIN1 Non-essential component of U5 snRNP n=1 Tax=Maudiozyma saulgeensis TaxID=1789683 RepID=A0A1X7R231_9SACH|nr:similar to Saccharomyces cerevisiae YHR156C LIN1 Non-essential component of U5 snRNP [Kazachstania saulgeensis]